MASDLVIGVFDRAQLSDALIAVHRAGLGPQARVLDSARGSLVEQLRTIGARTAVSFGAAEAETVLVVIGAPGRADRAITTLRRAGARDILGAGQPLPPAPMVIDPAAIPDSSSPPAEVH